MLDPLAPPRGWAAAHGVWRAAQFSAAFFCVFDGRSGRANRASSDSRSNTSAAVTFLNVIAGNEIRRPRMVDPGAPRQPFPRSFPAALRLGFSRLGCKMSPVTKMETDVIRWRRTAGNHRRRLTSRFRNLSLLTIANPEHQPDRSPGKSFL